MADAVLEEVFDPSYEPTQIEIEEYAEFLGMKLDEDEAFLWIAREGLKAPLPSQWKPCQTDTGQVYYFNFATKESIWEHPCDEYYRNIYTREKSKLDSKDTLPGEFHPSVTIDQGAALETAAALTASNRHEGEQVTSATESKNESNRPSRLKLNPVLPKLGASDKASESTLPPLYIPSIQKLSSREMPGPAFTNSSRQGSQRDLSNNENESSQSIRNRTASYMNQTNPYLNSLQLKKLTSSNSTNGIAISAPIKKLTSSNTTSSSDIAVTSSSSTKLKKLDPGSRSRSASQISLPPSRLPSIQSIQLEQIMQKQIDQQASHIKHLETELRDRVQAADGFYTERTRDLEVAKLQYAQNLDAMQNELLKEHQKNINQIERQFEDRLTTLQSRIRLIETENSELRTKLENSVSQHQNTVEHMERTNEQEISGLKHLNSVQLESMMALQKQLDLFKSAELRDSSKTGVDCVPPNHEFEMQLVCKLEQQLKLANEKIDEYEKKLSTERDTVARRSTELIHARAQLQSLHNLPDPQRPIMQSIATQTNENPIRSCGDIIFSQNAPVSEKITSQSINSESSRQQESTSSASSSIVSMCQEETSYHHSRRRTSVQFYNSSPRPRLLKSRITREHSDYSISINNLDSELHEVESSLNHVMNRVQNRCRLNTQSLNLNRQPTLLPEISIRHDMYETYEMECNVTERKLREHTCWLKTFLDQLDPS